MAAKRLGPSETPLGGRGKGRYAGNRFQLPDGNIRIINSPDILYVELQVHGHPYTVETVIYVAEVLNAKSIDGFGGLPYIGSDSEVSGRQDGFVHSSFRMVSV